MSIMTVYYALNNFWIWFNLFVIAPFFVAFVFRFRNQSLSKYLWTDHLARAGLALALAFYLADTFVKGYVDGIESICQKAIMVHHVASFFIIGPLVINSYIPWWVNPIGFIHGWIVFFDDHVEVQYVYGVMMLYFQYMLYQKPYRNLKGYWVTRLAINFIWNFIIIYKVGDCSNFLPLEDSHIGETPEEGLLFR
jgi:hypothetical protein